jgi:hypothetical protein
MRNMRNIRNTVGGRGVPRDVTGPKTPKPVIGSLPEGENRD